MDSCEQTICGFNDPALRGNPCPVCGATGVAVSLVTVKSLILEGREATENSQYCLCPSPDCQVVYFNEQHFFEQADLKVPVWYKVQEGPVPVCYCAGVTDRQIIEHVSIKGCCSTLLDIQKHTGANTGKECLTKNPSGR